MLLTPTQDPSAVHARPEVELESVACPLCQGGEAALVLTAPVVGGEAEERFAIVECQACGMHFTNPRPTLETISHYYPSDYSCYDVRRNWDERPRARLRRYLEREVLRASHGYPPSPGIATHVGAIAGRSWIRRRIQRCFWIPFVESGKLLDVGCGSGAFLKRMRQLGWQAEGLDFSPVAAERAQAWTGCPVRVDSLPSEAIPPSSFDVVTMWQVLEHTHHPREFIRGAREITKPGGWIYLSVPNFAGWSRTAFGAEWVGVDVPRHLLHFTPDCLSRLLSSEGWQVKRVETLGMDGWIRESARRSAGTGDRSRKTRACQGKQGGQVASWWTERRGLGDYLFAAAQNA